MFLHALESRLLFSGDEGPGLIVFNTNRDGNFEIYSMNPDGTDLHNLSNNPATDAIPQVSDDGSKVAFASDRGHPGNMDVWLMDIDGSHLVNITHDNLPGASNWDPAPSPDNSKVLYMAPGADGTYDIWVSKSNGTDPVDLTNSPGSDAFASWSDDGTKIVFGSFRNATAANPNNEEIYWMNADGTNQTRVTNNLASDNYGTFSPDGKHIAFTSERDGNREIYQCDLDGSHLVNLTKNPGATDQVPYYSPDGKQISFISDRDGNEEIYVMNADGSNQTRITNNPAEDVYPGWGDTPELITGMTYDFNAAKPTLRVQFGFDVGSTLSKDDLQLTNTTTGATIDPSNFQMSYNPATYAATFTFASLSDGNYVATIASGAVADQAGHALADDETADFFALAGDANQDRTVNALDFDALASHFGQAGAGFAGGDFNYDGTVGTSDFAILASEFGKTLPPAAGSSDVRAPVASAVPDIFAGKRTIRSDDRTVLL